MKSADREAILGAVRQRFGRLAPFLTEPTRRFWAAAEALAIGRGGPSIVAAATGLARATILRGQHDLSHPETLALPKERRPGGGRKPLCETDPTLLRDLDRLIDPHTRGDPESPLRWTSKSTVSARPITSLTRRIPSRGRPLSWRSADVRSPLGPLATAAPHALPRRHPRTLAGPHRPLPLLRPDGPAVLR